MRPLFVSAVAFALAVSFTNVSAATNPMKPGLWEMTIKSDAMKAMPKISPEQIAQMQKMGIKMPDMRDGGMLTQVCMTKEMLARSDAPVVGPNEGGCEPKNFQRNGDQYSMDLICNGPEMKGEGKIKGTFSGSEKFTSNFQFKGIAGGQPVNQIHETSGKWLSSDCGKVKPVDVTGKK